MGLKQKLLDAKKAATDFYKEYKEPINKVAIGLGGIAIGSYITYKIVGGAAVEASPEIKQIEEPKTETATTDETKEAEPQYESWNQWSEDQRENWDKVNEFAAGLELRQGEEYILEGPNTYSNHDDVMVHHLINGTGSYPRDPDPTDP